MKQKQKKCGVCEKEFPKLWKSKTRTTPAMCQSCWARFSAAQSDDLGKGDTTPIRRSTIAQKPRKATGELKLFMKIFAERKGMCEITGKQIPFDVKNFAHILSKGAYGSFRLNPDNIIHVLPEIHDLYDNSDKETLLSRFPGAAIIYEKKDELRYKYYNS